MRSIQVAEGGKLNIGALIIAALVFVTLIAMPAGMPDQAFASQAKKGVTLSAPAKKTLQKSKSWNLKAKLKVTKGAKLTYKSSKTSVASVSKTGFVKAKALGNTTITVTAKKGKAKTSKKVKVTVVKKKTSQSTPAEKQHKNFDDFAQAVTEIVKDHDDNSVNMAVAENDEFYFERLVVQDDGTEIDFTPYGPAAVVRSGDGMSVVQFDSHEATERASAQLQVHPHVQWVQADRPVQLEDSNLMAADFSAAEMTADYYSWGVEATGANKLAGYLRTKGGSVTVAVVDTGVSSHAFLNGRLLPGGYDFVDGDSDPNDQHYHGTHVAGTIVDCTPGIGVDILPVRVLNAQGQGTLLNTANGIKYAANHGAKVINLSLGGSANMITDSAVEYAISQGITVVVAAGNDNSNTNSYSPAHLTNAVVVAALNKDNTKARFSNYGNSVDLAAPGVGITSCVPNGGYMTLNGTSMATPHVSAAAAMIKLMNPNYSPAQVESSLKSHTTDLNTSGWDSQTGYGIPSLGKYVDEQQPQTYTVNFQANGGTGSMASQVMNSNTTTTLKANAFTRSGYTFTCWNTRSDGQGSSYANCMSVRNLAATGKSITLYAQWKADAQQTQRTVNVGIDVVEITEANGTKKVIIPDGTYLVRNVMGRYLDVSWGSPAPDANVQIWQNTGATAQYWIFRHKGDGYYTLNCAASNLRLDAVDGGTSNGVNVRQWTANDGGAEYWHAEIVDNSLVFVNKFGGRVLNVSNGANANGTNVNVWQRTNSNAQKWTLSKASYTKGTSYAKIGDITVSCYTNADGYMTVNIPNGTYYVQSALGKYLDVAGASTNAGTNVQLWTPNGSTAQRWKITSLGDGCYTLKSVCSNLCLDVRNAENVNGANVQQWTPNGSDAQRWKVVLCGNELAFVNMATGRALDVKSAVNADGQNVHTWENNGTVAQHWTLRKVS